MCLPNTVSTKGRIRKKGEHTGSPLRYIPKDRKLLVGFLNFWKNKKPPRKMLGGLDFVQPKNLKFSAE